MEARRSSRANRASQPLPSVSHHSSASSNSSSRAERATRSHQKTESPRKSTPSGSLSSDAAEDKETADDSIQTRRKRGRGDEKDKGSKAEIVEPEVTNDADDMEEDDGTVRCICAFEDYPGPPQLDAENGHGVREGIEGSLINPADVTEDLAGFFLQCDICKVWQHGGCVGIMSEKESPDEYFCEECRKDLHKIYTAPSGQRYSHYLPLYQSISRTTSRAASFSKDGTRSPRSSKNGRPSSSAQSAKRRSTMNSRDAAYDEEEQLRRAIEASKGDKSGESIDSGGIRRGKRGRSESEERKPDTVKRQRTNSASPSPTHEPHRFASQADSDDGVNARSSGSKKIRGAAAKNHKEKTEREERERLRLEAKKKREGRAERRRIDDSEPVEEDAATTRQPASKSHEIVPQPLDPPPVPLATPIVPDTPTITQPSTSHKKGGRPPNARKGKSGKNQYTKDRDPPDGEERSPGRSQSRDVVKGDENGHSPKHKGSINEGKPGKLKIGHSKISMTDMKRRVASILDFIARTQLELAGEPMSLRKEEATGQLMRGVAESLPMVQVNGDKGEGLKEGENKPAATDFKDLSCLDMMDVLTRQLVKWQNEFT
ncbi:hypothetical protein B0O99DRAFT_634094 [Bisporella sp. PMI_857]|nr:hypothetical protein B0O99DRAFT_634094 [Bisporella sp. PMI_857]